MSSQIDPNFTPGQLPSRFLNNSEKFDNYRVAAGPQLPAAGAWKAWLGAS